MVFTARSQVECVDAKLYLIDWIKQARNRSYRQFHTLVKSIEKRLGLITNWV